MQQSATNVVQMPAPVIPARRKARLKLTDANVKAFPFQGADDARAAKHEQRAHTFGPDERLPAIYYDTEITGLFVMCHRTSRSYYVQHDINGKSVMVNLGRCDTLKLAGKTGLRAVAMATLASMKSGVNPNEQKQARKLKALADAETDAFTLRDAVKLHLYERNKQRSEKTITEYQRIFDTHMAHLMDKPVTWLGANQIVIRNLHETITRRGYDSEARKGRGRRKRKPAPYSANGMVRAFCAVYNYARNEKLHLNLPEFRPFDMNPTRRRDSSLTLDQLPIWHEHITKLPNPVRRDFNLFALFTGNRSTATSEMQWEHVDLTGAVNGIPSVFIPTPKGGRAKAFFIPLSDYLVKLLQKRRACEATNAAFPESPWVFPALDSESGHIEEPKEKQHAFLEHYSPHALRHSYASFAQGAQVMLTDISFLMNHRPANLTVSYMRGLLPELVKHQQKITNYIKEHMTPEKSGQKESKIAIS